ncbi:MAG: hypothetical protein QF741_00305 [Candidatus Peribacteraceae bacterium]|jgi:hypothetical protein|nr:hypothetical protein [Candidatus Peribacteraceae bacterium]MDP7454187.1 hypothetical protein [Candidatus Peribacteraceae bacterium]MDP7645701.1 hypothetical protein [Candidatus Peribacteraceae bacterium]|tara:strand:- start:823 stop:1044 length:222 start_codon:yes stop_codon:yes gene_type:complete
MDICLSCGEYEVIHDYSGVDMHKDAGGRILTLERGERIEVIENTAVGFKFRYSGVVSIFTKPADLMQYLERSS